MGLVELLLGRPGRASLEEGMKSPLILNGVIVFPTFSPMMIIQTMTLSLG
jgi:hypothetical protein